ncbi:hypothetical protein QVD17_18941 [Tagetes erecta]|uniref:Uncharacterized protein n=1 Tax=Tagetes erecta TaxID=13708 RepID=A0AAD8KIK8_TARER|nr:hypothetical protein QVD17_18941 [Tagetes erecta]
MRPRINTSLCKLLTTIRTSSSKPTSLFPSKTITTFSKPDFYHKPLYTHFNICRSYNVETDKAVDEINLKFAEAREEIEMAMESKETVYFNEEAESARAVVKQVLDMYDALLSNLPDKERGGIQRSMGLKIEQLKAELQQLNE